VNHLRRVINFPVATTYSGDQSIFPSFLNQDFFHQEEQEEEHETTYFEMPYEEPQRLESLPFSTIDFEPKPKKTPKEPDYFPLLL
jgi:hypothetical protein